MFIYFLKKQIRSGGRKSARAVPAKPDSATSSGMQGSATLSTTGLVPAKSEEAGNDGGSAPQHDHPASSVCCGIGEGVQSAGNGGGEEAGLQRLQMGVPSDHQLEGDCQGEGGELAGQGQGEQDEQSAKRTRIEKPVHEAPGRLQKADARMEGQAAKDAVDKEIKKGKMNEKQQAWNAIRERLDQSAKEVRKNSRANVMKYYGTDEWSRFSPFGVEKVVDTLKITL